MKVAIITVNFNGKKDTIGLLRSLKLLKRNGLEIKIIVVDNGSEDGLVRELKNDKDVEVLQTGSNLGYAGGYNRGIEYAQIWGADYFLLINNDALTADPSLLLELIKTAKADPKIGLVSPKIYFAKGFEFHKERYKKEDKGKVIWYGGGQFDWDNITSVHRGLDEVDKGQYEMKEEVNFVSGACMLIKRQVLEKTGLFNEDYFLYFEDVEFQKRVTEAGFKIYYNGQVSIHHKVSQSTGIGSNLTDYYHSRNRLIFGMKYGRNRTKFALTREAIKLFVFGRSAQRQGVLDFYLGVKGGKYQGVNLTHPGSVRVQVEYPVKLSVGIVNYNTADLTKKLLESIFSSQKLGVEVIVLDNGSDDNCAQVIKEFLPKIKYLQNEQNQGFSKGYNKTIKYSLGEYYLMLNSDIEVLENGLSEMIKWADNFKGETVLGGKLKFPDGSDQDSAFHIPTLTGAFKEYFLAKKGSYFMFEPEGDKPTKVEGLVMACLMIPKKVLDKVGLLDEGSFIFFEDIEYARRLKQSDIPLYFVPTAQFIHHHGASTKRIGQEKAYQLLKKASQHYHGKIYYYLLTWVLKIGQKLGRVKTPVSRWTQN